MLITSKLLRGYGADENTIKSILTKMRHSHFQARTKKETVVGGNRHGVSMQVVFETAYDIDDTIKYLSESRSHPKYEKQWENIVHFLKTIKESK